MDILDVIGRSGAAYRFRRVPTLADLPAHAGNFLVARPTPDGAEISVIGSYRRLMDLGRSWEALAVDGVSICVRLNVSRATRQAEQADIRAALPKAEVVEERD